MSKQKTKIYTFRYKHGPANCEVRIPSTSKTEALLQFEALKATGEYVGESEVPKFDSKRCDELMLLREMVKECHSLNSGNGIVERIGRLTKLADQLDNSDWRSERQDFMAFLKEFAITNRFVASEQP